MRYVQITTDDDRFRYGESFQIVEKCRVPRLSTGNAAEIVFCIRGIDGDQPKPVELGSYDTTLIIEIAIAIRVQSMPIDQIGGHVIDDLNGFDPAEDRRPAVAGLARRVPEFLVIGKIDFSLALPGFGLLEAKDVGLAPTDVRLECTLSYDSSQAIDIPRGEMNHAVDFPFNRGIGAGVTAAGIR